MEIKFSKRRRGEGDRDGARGERGKEMVREGWRSGSAEPEKRAPPDPRTAPRLRAARRGPRAPRVPPPHDRAAPARPRRPPCPHPRVRRAYLGRSGSAQAAVFPPGPRPSLPTARTVRGAQPTQGLQGR